MKNNTKRLSLAVFAVAFSAFAGSASAALASAFVRGGAAGPADGRFALVGALTTTYKNLTSLQREEKNKELAANGRGYWVTGPCEVYDVRQSDDYSTLKNKGFEVECKLGLTSSTTAMLYFPDYAKGVLSGLAKGDQVEFRGFSSQVTSIADMMTPHIQVIALYPPGKPPAASTSTVKTTSAASESTTKPDTQNSPASTTVQTKSQTVLKLKGNISDVRKQLLASGWAPRETFAKFTDGDRESLFGNAGDLYRAGFVEIERCAGTGTNPCTFNYVKDGACLRVITLGEFGAGPDGKKYFPGYDHHTRECPEPEILVNSARK